MWGTASAVRKHWLEVAWGLFAAANVTVMVGMPRWETIPFHFVWVSLTLLYGFRRWNRRSTVLVVGTVIAVTRAAMVVLMAWHAERHQAALEEVRRLAETERHMRERERQFVRNASHELRTPITVARGYTELVRSALAGTPRAADADVILDELNRLSRMGERLLLLAAAEHPAFLRRGVVELEPLIVSTVRRWATATPTRRWQVEINAEGSLPGDAERLEAALDALLENAVAFTSEGARIGVTAAAEGETAVIEVSDSGTGIPPEDLDRIFEPFARVARDRSRKNGGTGLGLAIVKAIVDAHGGTITVRSTVGQGSTFCIRLPGFREAPLDAREATPAPLASAVAEG